jgi:hypothetical protein
MIAYLLAAMMATTTPTKTDKLASWIVKVNPRVSHYASNLARAIVREAGAHRLDVATLAAIAWTESRYSWAAQGSAGEYGIWQLQLMSGYRHRAWDALRRARRVAG